MAKLPQLSVPTPSQPSPKLILLRNAAITLISLTLAALWIALGPHGDFLNGRAFTVSTLDQITYVFYNWSITLPLDSNSKYRFQAWNDRLAGKTTFVAVDSANDLGDPDKIVVNVETTAIPNTRPDRQFSISPWSSGQGLIGVDVAVYDNLPNPYGIAYANIIVYLPRNFNYKSLTWMTTPKSNGSTTSGLPGHKWDVHMNNLTAAGMHFQEVKIYTDSGDIDADGVPADAGTFATMGGNIAVDHHTIPSANLSIDTSWTGNYTLNY